MIRYVFFALMLLMFGGVAYLALVQPPAPVKTITRTLATSELPQPPAVPNPQIIPATQSTVPMAAE